MTKEYFIKIWKLYLKTITNVPDFDALERFIEQLDELIDNERDSAIEDYERNANFWRQV